MSVFATIYQRLSESSELPWRALLLGVFVVGGLMIGVGKETEDENGWHCGIRSTGMERCSS